MEDLIRSSSNLDETLRRRGLEYDLKYRTENLNVFSGLSYVHEGAGHGNDPEAAAASRWMLKLGADYRVDKHGFSASLRSAGKRKDVAAYYLLNLNYRYQLSTRLKLFSSITNALDDKIIHPDTVNLNKIKIEARDGVGLLAGFSFEL